MHKIRTNSSPWFFLLLHFIYLSNTDELYDLHVKLTLLPHNHLERVESVHLRWMKYGPGLYSRKSVTLFLFRINLKIYYD